MGKINDGGRAFPGTQTKDDIRGNHNDIHSKWHGGITVRDYFAAKAEHFMLREYSTNELAAKNCYLFADAMIAEREKANG